jgi:hypothetical protein
LGTLRPRVGAIPRTRQTPRPPWVSSSSPGPRTCPRWRASAEVRSASSFSRSTHAEWMRRNEALPSRAKTSAFANPIFRRVARWTSPRWVTYSSDRDRRSNQPHPTGGGEPVIGRQDCRNKAVPNRTGCVIRWLNRSHRPGRWIAATCRGSRCLSRFRELRRSGCVRYADRI